VDVQSDLPLDFWSLPKGRSVGFAIRLHRIIGFLIRLEAFLALQMLIFSAVGLQIRPSERQPQFVIIFALITARCKSTKKHRNGQRKTAHKFHTLQKTAISSGLFGF
jgi:hypothetical protein